jgi:hypothetical protein
MTFPYFIMKRAPVTGVQSLLDYKATLAAELKDGKIETWLKVVVPVTSLCPCSKQISDYGAHNQRSHVTISVRISEHVWLEELIDVAEQEASCELYGILKRPDEKYVTERAYDNPKFVEDMVRDVAVRLNADDRIRAYVLETENFESIHNHSAYARVERNKDDEPCELPGRGPAARFGGAAGCPPGQHAQLVARVSPFCRREISDLRKTLLKRNWQEEEACSSSVELTRRIVTSLPAITAAWRLAPRR